MVDLILLIHVVFGVTALISAFIAAANKKGAKNHRKVGRVFFWSMLGVGVTAIPVTFINPNPFLFFIAIFSFYMAFIGYRLGKPRYQPASLDQVAPVIMVITVLGMYWHGYQMITNSDGLGWALIAFGTIGLVNAIEDIVELGRNSSHSRKVIVHLSRMLGGTIATITAVLVQQISPLVESDTAQLLIWLGPTVVITPLIVWWNIKVRVTGKYRLFS
ncbi:MAG: hypothetical protein O2926_01275 [Actinomycetota bacterium]|nr:hypothetical protein [Actinomycetota bacterium]